MMLILSFWNAATRENLEKKKSWMNSEDRESKCGEGQVAERRYIEMVINRGQRKAWQIIINVDSRTRTHTHTTSSSKQNCIHSFNVSLNFFFLPIDPHRRQLRLMLYL